MDILTEHTNKQVVGDKAYISAAQAAELWRTNRLRLWTLPRKNQKEQLPKPLRRLFNAVRQIIETVNDQLNEQFPNNAQLEPAWGDIIVYWPDLGIYQKRAEIYGKNDFVERNVVFGVLFAILGMVQKLEKLA
jgi:hypothetical protein